MHQSRPQNSSQLNTRQDPHAANNAKKLRGVVERITFYNEENGYTVAKLLPERRSDSAGNSSSGSSRFGTAGEIAIIGNMAGINVGESVELTGRWTVHAEYGKQFNVENMRTVLPATIAGIEKYLGSGLIKGVGSVTAKRIVKHFQLETLEVIENDPQRLHEVPGVGKKRINMIIHAWAEQRAIKDVMIFLQGHGVSTSLATKIYKTYGDNAIGIVKQDPYRLARDIYGIGFLTADKIAKSMGIPPDAPQRIAAGVDYALNQSIEEGHVYLPSTELAQKTAELLAVTPQQAGIGIIHLWGDDAVKVADAPGAGEESFLNAAASTQDPSRVVDQHGTPQLLAEPGGIYAAATQDQVKALLAEPKPVYLTPFYYGEMGVANRLKRICYEGQSALQLCFKAGFNWAGAFEVLARESGLHLAPQQQDAVRIALTHRVTVLTGGPGTGKTTTVRTIMDLCRRGKGTVQLAAPTGRAAKRLAETTGEEARTIHRLLEFSPPSPGSPGISFKRNEESPLKGDLLIVDEASMLDLVMTNHLLKAVPSGMHVLFVGDVDQLPSVGAGNVLKDIIRAIEGQGQGKGEGEGLDGTSGVVADDDVDVGGKAGERVGESVRVGDVADVTEQGDGEGVQGAFRANPFDVNLSLGTYARVVRLQTIFRQEAGSFIVANAHRINQGLSPTIDNENATDFFVFKTEDPQRAAQLCVELVQERIPRRFAIPSGDIQVLCPMHRGVVGVGALNEALQEALNPAAPSKPQRLLGNRAYRLGDRVMQIRNNYDKEVYNGDMGTIAEVQLEAQKLLIDFEGRLVQYDFLELDEVVHSFAVSVHKSQGSEYPAVVIPVMTTHYMMLQRNLLYTGVTRAKRLVVLVGQPKAIAIAVQNNKVSDRFTGLAERLS